MAAAYGKKSYWDERYSRELSNVGATSGSTSFDWYGRFAHFKPLLVNFLKKSDYILVVGCGSSRMAEELYNSEYTSVANVDFSSVIIKHMAERHAERPTLTWKVADVTERLDFPPGTFSVCLDKAVLDCVLCADSSTNAVANALYNIIRVLKSDGIFILISHWGPEKWLGYLEQDAYNWRINVHAVTRPVLGVAQGDGASDAPVHPSAVHYVYVCEKMGDKLS